MKITTIKQTQLTKELILSKISDYDIYRMELGEFKVNKTFCNPLRKEDVPSFNVYMSQDGKLRHIDYADSRYHGDCWDIVCQKYGLNLSGAVRWVANTFGLIDGPQEKYKAIISQYIRPVISPKEHSIIQVTTKAYTRTDLAYWNKYLIDREDLKREEVYSVREVFLNRKRVSINRDELIFAYYYPEGFKIYRPTQKKTEKWLSNITTARIENLQAIDTNKQIIVTKAKKCRMCLSKLVDGVISTQNESRSCFTESLIEKLKDKDVYIQYDSDAAGKKNSWALTSSLGYRHLNVPDNMLEYGVKDFSDWVAYDGNTKRIEDFLKSKNII